MGRDRETGLCKGFAYVNFEDRASADQARQKLDGYPYSNLILSCQWSQPRGEPPGKSKSGGGGGGGAVEERERGRRKV